MKAMILAGGLGARFHLAAKVAFKQLFSVYTQPRFLPPHGMRPDKPRFCEVWGDESQLGPWIEAVVPRVLYGLTQARCYGVGLRRTRLHKTASRCPKLPLGRYGLRQYRGRSPIYDGAEGDRFFWAISNEENPEKSKGNQLVAVDFYENQVLEKAHEPQFAIRGEWELP